MPGTEHASASIVIIALPHFFSFQVVLSLTTWRTFVVSGLCYFLYTSMLFKWCCVAAAVVVVTAHGDHEHQEPISGPHKSLWYNTIPGDGGTQVRRTYPLSRSSIDTSRPTPSSQASPPSVDCLTSHVSPATTRSLTSHSLVRGFSERSSKEKQLTYGRCTIRHGHIISSRSTLWTKWHSTRFSPPQSLVRAFRSVWKLTSICWTQGSRKVRFSGGYNV